MKTEASFHRTGKRRMNGFHGGQSWSDHPWQRQSRRGDQTREILPWSHRLLPIETNFDGIAEFSEFRHGNLPKIRNADLDSFKLPEDWVSSFWGHWGNSEIRSTWPPPIETNGSSLTGSERMMIPGLIAVLTERGNPVVPGILVVPELSTRKIRNSPPDPLSPQIVDVISSIDRPAKA